MPLDLSHLGVYLNDHLAGSRAAVALLERLESAFAESEIGVFARELRTEIQGEQTYLGSLITSLTAGKSLTRQTAGWLSGMFAALKLKVDDPSTTDFFLFESLEALSLGIEGKRSLWIALQILADREPALNKPELRRLQEQAERQRGEVESRRRSAAPAALTTVET